MEAVDGIGPAYRGVDKRRLSASLGRAWRFLRGLDLGPATNRLLDDWLARRPGEAIAAAGDEAALAQAMREFGPVFRRFHDVFEHHALAEIAGQGDVFGRAELYRELAAWGAFVGAESMDYRPIDAEKGLYLVGENARFLSRRPEARRAGAARLRAIAAEFGREEPEEARWLVRAVPGFIKARERGEKRAAMVFLGLSFHQRHLLMRALGHMTGLAEHRERLGVESPLGVYGVAVDGLPTDYAGMRERLGPIADRARRALAPFNAVDEVEMAALGRITKDRSGYMFVATLRAAQAVAEALPEENVIDSQGRQVVGRRPAGRLQHYESQPAVEAESGAAVPPSPAPPAARPASAGFGSAAAWLLSVLAALAFPVGVWLVGRRVQAGFRVEERPAETFSDRFVDAVVSFLTGLTALALAAFIPFIAWFFWMAFTRGGI